jgi:transketolase
MPLDPLKEKYEAFNWNAIEVDGNNIEEFIKAIENAKLTKDRPTVIIAKTIPGKGVSFMENEYCWHGKAPNKEETEKALNELKYVKS